MNNSLPKAVLLERLYDIPNVNGNLMMAYKDTGDRELLTTLLTTMMVEHLLLGEAVEAQRQEIDALRTAHELMMENFVDGSEK